MSAEIEEQNKNIKVYAWDSTTFWALGKKECHSDLMSKLKTFMKTKKQHIQKLFKSIQQ